MEGEEMHQRKRVIADVEMQNSSEKGEEMQPRKRVIADVETQGSSKKELGKEIS